MNRMENMKEILSRLKKAKINLTLHQIINATCKHIGAHTYIMAIPALVQDTTKINQPIRQGYYQFFVEPQGITEYHNFVAKRPFGYERITTYKQSYDNNGGIYLPF